MGGYTVVSELHNNTQIGGCFIWARMDNSVVINKPPT